MAKRPLIIALTAAAALAVPALSTPASATCWITCQPPIIKPGPTPVATADTQAGDDATAVDASFLPYACADESAAAAPDIGLDCPPEYTWVCCSPPGGPVCCSPPDGGPLVCSGEGPSPLPSAVDAAVVVDGQTEACLASVSEPAVQDEILECRPEDEPTYVASVLVRLLALLA